MPRINRIIILFHNKNFTLISSFVKQLKFEMMTLTKEIKNGPKRHVRKTNIK